MYIYIDMIIGSHIATVRIRKTLKKPVFEITLPTPLLNELNAKGETFEHLDQVRITIEKVGTKAKSKPWGFKRKIINSEEVSNLPTKEVTDTSAVKEPEI